MRAFVVGNVFVESDRVDGFYMRNGLEDRLGVRVQPSVPLCYSSFTLMILKGLGNTNSITTQGIRFLNKGISTVEIADAR
jgi:hypothetical protein